MSAATTWFTKFGRTLLLAVVCATPAFSQSPTDSEAMEAARRELLAHHGGQTFAFVEGERLELGSTDERDFALWDLQAWIGGDIERLWIKTEGEWDRDQSELEEGEIQALYSRAITPFFDLQLGLRHDFEPSPSRSFLVVGLQGLAPYWFEVDTALFVSDDGDVSARFEAEYDILVTQRLIFQPRTELEVAFQEVPELGIGSGINGLDLELRARYEIVREFAPYVGISWHGLFGETADLAESVGEETSSLAVVVGFRFWY